MLKREKPLTSRSTTGTSAKSEPVSKKPPVPRVSQKTRKEATNKTKKEEVTKKAKKSSLTAVKSPPKSPSSETTKAPTETEQVTSPGTLIYYLLFALRKRLKMSHS